MIHTGDFKLDDDPTDGERADRDRFEHYGAQGVSLLLSDSTNVDVRWSVRRVRGLTVGLEARNLFDHRGDRIATLDGYPNPYINTVYDDYGAYRTLTGRDGGGYLVQPASGPSYWVAVHDARLAVPPRAVRASLALRW